MKGLSLNHGLGAGLSHKCCNGALASAGSVLMSADKPTTQFSTLMGQPLPLAEAIRFLSSRCAYEAGL